MLNSKEPWFLVWDISLPPVRGKVILLSAPLGREGDGTPLQYSCLENPIDGGTWWAAVHGVTKSRTRLSDFTFTFHFHALEKEMATHSSVLAWRIPGMGEPRGLPSMGLHRVGLDWSNLAAAAPLGAMRGDLERVKFRGEHSDCLGTRGVVFLFSTQHLSL